MNIPVIYTVNRAGALEYAVRHLTRLGCKVADTPGPEVTHLLLGAPAFEADGTLRGGGDLPGTLETLSRDITVCGGNLGSCSEGYRTVDFLSDPYYLAQNANITAHCALRLAMDALPVTLEGCPVLVIGWGRIGKCLGWLLRQLGAFVTVAARKDSDRAALHSLGYDTLDSTDLGYSLARYRVIFNTVPFPVMDEAAVTLCSDDCVMIDLASQKGIAGDRVLWARGLPGKYAPESSGELIAKTLLRHR